MFKKFLMTTLVLGMTGAATVPAIAQDGPPPPPPPGGPGHYGHHGPHGPGGMHGMMPLLAGVDLTKAQRDKLKSLHKGKHDAMHAQMKEMHDIDSQIMTMLMADGSIDHAKLEDLLKRKDALLAQGDQERLNDAIAVHDILTPAQRAKARETFAKMESLRSQMHDLMKPPAPPSKED